MAIDLIGNIRIMEDSLALVLITIAIVFLAYSSIKLKNTPQLKVPLAILIGIIPFWVWKSLGAIRRVAIDKAASPELYDLLHNIGEVFESLSGIVIFIAFLYLFLQFNKLGKK